MNKDKRIWIGATLLVIVLLNYLSIGVPLYKRVISLDDKVKMFTRRSEDTYIVDVLKREIITIDKKIVLLNCVAASVAIMIVSWVVFGLVVQRPDRRRV